MSDSTIVQEQEKIYTADDFWEISHSPENQDKRLELVEGVIYEMSPAGGKHGEIAMEIGMFIRLYVKEHRLGRVTAAETGYILFKNPDGKDTVRAPDVGFVAMERAPDGLPKGYVPFAPDLAVEVISPGNTAGDIHNKMLELLRAGTRIVWIIYPDSQTVVVHTPEGAKTLEINDTLDGGDVLPGFTLPVKDVFAI